MAQTEKDVQTKIGRPLEGNELLSYLMYPKVFTDYRGDAEPLSARSRCCRRLSSFMA